MKILFYVGVRERWGELTSVYIDQTDCTPGEIFQIRVLSLCPGFIIGVFRLKYNIGFNYEWKIMKTGVNREIAVSDCLKNGEIILFL